MRRRRNPSMDITRHISHGFYRLTDREAGMLARNTGAPLPKSGYELRVKMPDGKLMWLTRTPVSGYRGVPGFFWVPKRGWVWSVY